MLLRLYRLMKAVGISSSGHNTSRKFIYDKNLIILNNVISVLEHKIMCTERKYYIMLNFKVFGIRKVIYVEEFLRLCHTFLGQRNDLVFFVYDKIACLRYFLAHDGCHLCDFTGSLAFFELLCEDIACLIKLCGFPALSGNNKRRSRLVNKHGIDLVDNGIYEVSLHELSLIYDHVVTKIIKSVLVIRNVCDIACVSLTSLVILHGIQNNADGEP